MLLRAARLPLIALVSLSLVSPAVAQSRGQGARPAAPAAKPAEPPPPPPASETPPPPYEKELLRLAEVLGSLAFLRGLCAASDAAEWPRRMQALVDAEGVTAGRKERLAGAYNRGYRAFALTYRVCTPSAQEATARYLKEGETVSRTLAGRYGG
jgi:uncharacterized protein (TIGR02301 family)